MDDGANLVALNRRKQSCVLQARLMAALLKSSIDIGARDDRSRANNRPGAYHGAPLVGLDVDRP
jgi:hypothetical protein